MSTVLDKSKGRIPTGFYSAVPRERVVVLGQAKREFRTSLISGLPRWPTMSPGSLNAWLVFLGPSPGNSPGATWDYDPLPSVGGAHGGVAEYVDGKGFWHGIREFARVVFPELRPADAYAATMVRNLDPGQFAVAPKGEHMHRAATEVIDVLGKLIRPRLVVSLGGARKYTDRAFQGIPGAQALKSGVLYTARKRERREWFSLVANWHSGDPFLYVSPSGVHPSLFHVAVGDTLQFLREQSEIARSL